MASAKQIAQRSKFKSAFKACRPLLAEGKGFGSCMSGEMKRGGKAKKAKRSKRK